MFSTKNEVLRFFYDEGCNISLSELETKFDNNNREELLQVVTDVEKENYIVWAGSAIWVITEIGVKHYEEEVLEKSKRFYEGTNFIITIVVAILTVIGVAIAMKQVGWL